MTKGKYKRKHRALSDKNGNVQLNTFELQFGFSDPKMVVSQKPFLGNMARILTDGSSRKPHMGDR